MLQQSELGREWWKMSRKELEELGCWDSFVLKDWHLLSLMGEIWRGFSRGVKISDLLFKGALIWLTLKTVSELPFKGIMDKGLGT